MKGIFIILVCFLVTVYSSPFLGFNSNFQFQEEVECSREDEFIPSFNCSNYYHCSNGQPVLITCPGLLFFNPRTNLCDFPDQVPECVGGTRPPIGTPPIPTQQPTQAPTEQPTQEPTQAPTQQPTQEPTQAPTQPPTQQPTQQPTQEPTQPPTQPPTQQPTQNPPDPEIPICEEDDTTLPHWNCSMYYLCDSNQVPLPQTCQSPLYYNPRIRACDFDYNVPECVGGTRPPTGGTLPNTPKPTDAPTQPPTDAPTQQPTEQPTEIPTQQPTQNPICPDQTTIYKVPYPDDCKFYYLCVFGEPHLDSCSERLLFDINIRDCVREEDAVCYNAPTEAPTTKPPHVCRPGEVYNVEFEGDCSKYILCANGVPVLQTCSTGTIFNPAPEFSKCVLESEYDCPWGLFR